MAGRLVGKRILIVEDEYFIASDLKRALAEEEAVVVGPVSELARGLSLAGGESLDAAVLDVNLEGATSYTIADRLSDRAVPFMFLTGYDGWALPEPYRGAPRLGKPFVMKQALSCLETLVARSTVS